MQQIIELFSIDAYGDKPLFWITFKTDGGDMDVLGSIGMLTIQTTDDRIFLPEMFFDNLFVTVITILYKVQYMRPSTACHDISVMVQKVHVEVLVLVDPHRHLQLLMRLLVERKRAFCGKSKGTLVVNTGKSTGAFLFMPSLIVSEVCVVDKRFLYISKSFGSRTTATGSPSKGISGIKSISLFFIPR